MDRYFGLRSKRTVHKKTKILFFAKASKKQPALSEDHDIIEEHQEVELCGGG